MTVTPPAAAVPGMDTEEVEVALDDRGTEAEEVLDGASEGDEVPDNDMVSMGLW